MVVARDRGELRSAFTTAATCTIGGRSSLYPGVLVEEFLDGAEYSVDSLTVDGCTHPLVVAEKRLGFAPYFEETGHVVAAAIPPELADGLELVRRAHQVIGLDRLITHSEFRLTSGGPRLIEINARLGGDLIPHLGQLATGVDFVSLGAQAALGLTRTWEPRDGGCAAIRFFYPPHDMDFHSVQLAGGAADHAGLVSFAAAAEPGERLLLPPRDFAARAAYAIVTGAEPSACEAALDRIAGCVEIRGAAVGDSVVAGV